MEGNTLPQRSFIEELSEDILREIFIHCLGKSRPDKHAPPLLFCRICKYWREVALSEPRLWNAIEISTFPRGQIPLMDRLPGLISWIHRAQTLPKNIFFSFKHPESLDGPLDLELFTGPLSSCRQLTIRSSCFPLSFQPRDVDVAPMVLESFELLCHPSHGIIDDLVPFIRTATRLRKLTLDILTSKLVGFDSLWGQITHLNLIRIGMTQPEWINIIRKAKRLEKAAFLIYGRLHSGIILPNTQASGITLPYLTHLVIRFQRLSGNAVRILEGINVPALVYLKVARAWNPLFSEPQMFSPHPLQHLRTLCLLHTEFTTDDIFNVLQTATMLQALSITDEGHSLPEYLRLLIYSEVEGHALVPRLATFSLTAQTDAVLQVLTTIAASRQSIQLSDGTYSLRRLILLKFQISPLFSQEEMYRIRKLKSILNVAVKLEPYRDFSLSVEFPWRDV